MMENGVIDNKSYQILTLLNVLKVFLSILILTWVWVKLNVGSKLISLSAFVCGIAKADRKSVKNRFFLKMINVMKIFTI